MYEFLEKIDINELEIVFEDPKESSHINEESFSHLSNVSHIIESNVQLQLLDNVSQSSSNSNILCENFSTTSNNVIVLSTNEEEIVDNRNKENAYSVPAHS